MVGRAEIVRIGKSEIEARNQDPATDARNIVEVEKELGHLSNSERWQIKPCI